MKVMSDPRFNILPPKNPGKLLPESKRRICIEQRLSWGRNRMLSFLKKLADRESQWICRFTGDTPLCWYKKSECILNLAELVEKEEQPCIVLVGNARVAAMVDSLENSK